MTSRVPGFFTLPMEERLRLMATLCDLTAEDVRSVSPGGGLTLDQADRMIENALGLFAIPFGVATNFLVNGKSYFVPMVVEEPSIVASASNMAKIVRKAGGFTANASDRLMVGQVQVVHCSDWESARQCVLQNKDALLSRANDARPSMKARGGGAQDLDVKLLTAPRDKDWLPMLVIQVTIDTRDAMGANVIDSMMEAIAPDVEAMTGGRVYLRILSNYTDNCLAEAHCRIPPDLLATEGLPGEEVRDRIIQAYAFAELDLYRAVTHNKGIMNGIDAVAVATGNDWRALEAACHAYAVGNGQYHSMTRWAIAENGDLMGALQLPMPVGTVGGAIRINPAAQTALKILHISRAMELAEVMVSVGLAQNLAALRALVTEGIQRGHMALHARAHHPGNSGV